MTTEVLLEQLKTLQKEIGDKSADLKKQQDELKDAHRTVMDAITKGVPLATDVQKNIDDAITKMVDGNKQVVELAQSINDLKKAIKDGPAKPVTLREQLMKSLTGDDAQKAAHTKMIERGGSLRMVVKNIDMAAVAGITPQPYVDALVSLQRRPLRVRDLLPSIPVNTDSVKYGVQNVRTNNAAIVAEGAAKPYSNYGWTTATASVEVIAHLAKLTLQAIADAPRLVAEVESEMRFGLASVEDVELLNGDGTSGHLNGLNHQATAYALPAGADATLVRNPADKLRAAILQMALQYFTPDGVVLNPVDVFNIRLLRDGQGNYLFGTPATEGAVKSLWGVPLVETAAEAVGNFLLGDFQLAASLYVREGVTALISTENADDFEKNLATMRVEERLGLGVKRPLALVKGTLATGS